MNHTNTESRSHKVANRRQAVWSRPKHQGRAPVRTAKSSLRCCRVFVKFSGARTKNSPDPASGIFAHFIICLLHKLLLNGKQMDGQQVWEQMAFLGEEEKLRAERQRVLKGGSVPLPHGRRLPRDLLRQPVLLVGSSHLCWGESRYRWAREDAT